MWNIVLKDNLKACVPFRNTIRRVVRRLRPYRSMPENDALATSNGLQILKLVRQYDLSARDVLEVGTGWIPTIPKLFKAHGAQSIVLTDVEPLCDAQTAALAASLAQKALPDLNAITGQDLAILESNLAREGIESYRCPPQLEGLPDQSIDLIYSRTVLEHIPQPALVALLQEWRRLLRPGGCCIHIIDNSDHFEHRDKRLSRLNFLTLTNVAWRVASFNGQNFQNRLRHSDYVTLFRDAGFELLHVEGEPDPKTLEDLKTLRINPAFAHYTPEDLATLTSIVIARNAPVAAAAN
ncbi:MAG: class I SAM-dependent methyltransferase [Pseudomonadota bacterium]